MPGIVGVITKAPREEAVSQVERMLVTLRHEQCYVLGKWVEESLGVYLGWAARKGSFSDGMPVQNEKGDAVLVFSGEEFSEPGTVELLKQRGHEVDLGDPSYLIHLYEEDSSFPARLNGRFHGLVIDRKLGSATLFNDRYGMKRIYYHQSRGGFYFAAEAKAILAVIPEARRIRARGLGEFIACGCTLEGRSLFDGVYVLPGGSRWVFLNGQLDRREVYFKPEEWENLDCLEPAHYYQEIREVFSRIVPRYFGGHEGIGMSLTGGLDSRMIMAWQKPKPSSLPCYTFGGGLRDCQDVIVARQVARECGQSHQVIRLGEEFFSQFPDYAARAVYLTDGCVEVDRAPDIYLNEKAREIAPVRMTGLFGGEVLRRVRSFKPKAPPPGLFAPEYLCQIYQAKETYASVLRGHPLSFAVFKQAPWHQYGGLALEETQISLRTPFLDNDFVRTGFRAPESALATSDVSLNLVADGNKALLRIPTDRGLAGGRRFLSEAASRAFLEFLFKAEYAYDLGMPQWVARVDHILSTLRLERLFLGRHKIFHFRVWYREALSQHVKEILLDPRTRSRPYLQPHGLEATVRGHLKGDRNFTSEISKLLTLELLHRLFLDPR